VARNPQSHTGRFLSRALHANGQAKRGGNGASKSAGRPALAGNSAGTPGSEP